MEIWSSPLEWANAYIWISPSREQNIRKYKRYILWGKAWCIADLTFVFVLCISIPGPSTTTETETVAKYEIMDGAPVKGNTDHWELLQLITSSFLRPVSLNHLLWPLWPLGESIPIRLFLAGYDLTATMRDVNKKFSVRYFLNLVLVDEEDRRYFKQQVHKQPLFLMLMWKVKCSIS